ncbi:MAG: signal peptidase [Marmoricola sp.]|nr:signal peptidase [Marmoricola sp.]
MDDLRIPLQRPAPAWDAAPIDGAASGALESGWGRVLAVSSSRAALAAVLGLLVWSVLPLVVGWTPRAIMSGSMEPRIHVGDVVVGRPVDPATLVKGQVVTVVDPDHPGRTRTHRLLRRDAQGRLVLKGDANPQADSTPVLPAKVLGIGAIRVPYVARPVYWVAERAVVPLGLTLLALVGLGLTAAQPLTLGSRSPRADRGPDRPDGPDSPGGPDGPGASGAPDAGTEPDAGLDVLDPHPQAVPVAVVTRLATTPAPRTVRRRLVLPLLVASVTALLVVGVAPTQAAYARTTGTTQNSWGSAVDFRPYRTAVLADSPHLFWRLGETSGTAVRDETAAARGGTVYNSGYAWGQPGALPSEAGTRSLALTAGLLTANTSVTGPAVFSVEAWIRTTTTSGGRILGFGDAGASTASTTVDRQLYVGTNGKVYFGVGTSKTVVASNAALNDGRWHHVVGTYATGAGGMLLYVDGVRQAATGTATPATGTGYWRAGAEVLSTWTMGPDNYYDGSLEELAVYTTTLSAARVKAHYDAGVTP